MRIYDLAKDMTTDLGHEVKSLILVKLAQELNITSAKAPGSNITDGEAGRVRARYLHRQRETTDTTTTQSAPETPETSVPASSSSQRVSPRTLSAREPRVRDGQSGALRNVRSRRSAKSDEPDASTDVPTEIADIPVQESSDVSPVPAPSSIEIPEIPETPLDVESQQTDTPVTASEPETIADENVPSDIDEDEVEAPEIEPEPELEIPTEPTVEPRRGDSRFGVVKTSSEAISIYGPVHRRHHKKTKSSADDKIVESKVARDDGFVPKVSYPSIQPIRRDGEEDDSDGKRRKRGGRKTKERKRERPLDLPKKGKDDLSAQPETVAAPDGPISIALPINLRGLSEAIGVKLTDIQKKLFLQGKMVSINESLTEEDIQLIALEFDCDVSVNRRSVASDELKDMEQKYRDVPHNRQVHRPPIVTVMGHVDHGKTSLLDRIRGAHVADGEAGGITQSIGAYQVQKGDLRVTFIDTPGHEAFTQMRARGANVTDVAVLVVAADDGVMPQTREAIGHARAAGVKLVAAITKIDLPSADVNRVKRQLAEEGLSPLEWGAENGIEMLEVSSVTGKGVDDLVETLALETEIMDLRAVNDLPATGHVLEAHLDEGRGITATLLIRHGFLSKGDIIVAGHSYGRVKQMSDDRGNELDEALPSMPVQIIGLSEIPNAGQKWYVLQDIKHAAAIAGEYQRLMREEEIMARAGGFKDVFKQMQDQAVKDLNIVLKADVRGSLEPIHKTLMELNTDEVRVRILFEGVGTVNESDALLASAGTGVIIAFNVIADQRARARAESDGIPILSYNIIYDVIADIKARLGGMLSPVIEKVIQSTVEIRDVFKLTKYGKVAGCRVATGTIARTHFVRLIRNGTIVWPPAGRDGEMVSLKRFKDDVKEVREGFECGIKLKDYDDMKPGDIIESYSIKQSQRTLDD